MANKIKKSLESKRHEVPIQGVYSNELGIGYSDTEVVINFGFSTPSYFEPHKNEEVPVTRVILSWEMAGVLLETLGGIFDKRKKTAKTKTKVKSKSKSD